ncbi:MAG: alpha/beta hydrolase [Chthoniobacteraceae bacterium]
MRLAHFLGAAVLACVGHVSAAQLEVVSITSAKLRGNPLGDPATRRIAVFTPDAAKNAALVVYLPGWGGSSEDAVAQGASGWFGEVVDRLAAKGMPFRIAVVDGRSRYGGSQFLNSTATGDYADYVADELVPALSKDGAKTCIIAGHSSGAYGALMLAISHHEKFIGVVALSPDSDFELTHKPIVQQPSVRAVTRAELEAAMAPAKTARLPADGTASLVMGLCANYAPTAGKPGRFDWLHDDRGAWRTDTWARWLALDPLTIVRKNPDAFAKAQRVYLDGAEHDEFGANIGARKIHEAIREKMPRSTFYESPGHHSDRLAERLARGLEWISEK